MKGTREESAFDHEQGPTKLDPNDPVLVGYGVRREYRSCAIVEGLAQVAQLIYGIVDRCPIGLP